MRAAPLRGCSANALNVARRAATIKSGRGNLGDRDSRSRATLLMRYRFVPPTSLARGEG